MRYSHSARVMKNLVVVSWGGIWGEGGGVLGVVGADATVGHADETWGVDFAPAEVLVGE